MAKSTGSLKDRLISNSTVTGTSGLDESKFFNEKDNVATPVLALNLALSSQVNKGMTSGILMLAGESKTFKTMFGLVCMAAYLKKYPEAIALFYDNEFGSPPDYIHNFGIDMARVVHVPIKNIEELKFDIVKQYENLTRGDKVFTFIDSVGNLASKKEVDDALEGKSVADMTRAKQLKSLFRMITPYLTMNDIPLVAVNHTYKSQGMYPTDVVGGGTGGMYSSNTVIIVKKRQVKEGKEFAGNYFDLFVEKSRYVKEKSRIPVKVLFGKPLSAYTGLFDLAEEMGYLVKPKQGWYKGIHEDDTISNHRRAEIEFSGEFWKSLFTNSDFEDALHNAYRLESLEMEEDEEEST